MPFINTVDEEDAFHVIVMEVIEEDQGLSEADYMLEAHTRFEAKYKIEFMSKNYNVDVKTE